MLKFAILVGIIAIGIYYYNLHQIVPGPIVSTKNGPVLGATSKTRDGKTFYEYFGIPYAEPPVGNLRYEPPQPLKKKWTEVRDATSFHSECPQVNLFLHKNFGHEDCLYLNVFTPKPGGKLKPVFVWIHGGLFIFGSSFMYRGDYLLDEDVVLVTLNYRLGALGFLNTGDGLVRGNMGLKDQRLALEWVQENIENFGGDPKNVILIGESAGGASTHYHLLSPHSNGLYHKAIIQSGVAQSSWTIKPNPAQQAKRYAKNLHCPTDDTKEMVKCLKQASVEELLRAHHEVTNPIKDPEVLFGPTVESVKDENTFIDEHPKDSIQKGRTLKVPAIIGYNSHEGLMMSPSIVRDPEIMEQVDQDFNKNMASILLFPTMDPATLNSIMPKVKNFYFGKGSVNSFDKFENYTNIITDFVWAEGINRAATQILQQKSPPVYLYYYTYKGKFTISNVLLALRGKFPVAVEFLIYKINRMFREIVLGETYIHYGACHADELALLFRLEGLYNVGTTHEDYEMSKKMVKLWTSFASSTNQPMTFQGVEWEPLQKNPKEIKYMLIDKESAMIPQPHPDRIDFWKTLL